MPSISGPGLERLFAYVGVTDVQRGNTLRRDQGRIVVAEFMPKIAFGVYSRTILALDASVGMKPIFGRCSLFNKQPNDVERVARKLGGLLCDATRDQKVSMIYWAVGYNGGLEEIGTYDKEECTVAKINGPKKKLWGRRTKILSTIKYIAESGFDKIEATMAVIITVGIIEDEKEAMDYCMKLGKRLVAEGQTELFRLVLIGVGEEVDVGQLERFEDMFEGTDLDSHVDFWSSGVAASMQDESDILAVLKGELMIMTEDMIADSGSILDGDGNEIIAFPDGMPPKVRFILPLEHTTFTVRTPLDSVTQYISEALC